MSFIEILKAIAFGLIEGFTEWIPVSSAAHIMILDEFIGLNATDEFRELFISVIRSGAMLAIIIIFFRKLDPFDAAKKPEQKTATWKLWLKIVIAALPVTVVGFLMSSLIEEKLNNGIVVSIALIFYGAAFIVFEYSHRYTKPSIIRLGKIDYQTALYVGCFQVLSLIPGTSRSAADILGALMLGCSRTIAAQFSIFLGIPIILGELFYGVYKYDPVLSGNEIIVLAVGTVSAFIAAVCAVRIMMVWIKKNSFVLFGYYRIGLGVVILLWTLISGLINA